MKTFFNILTVVLLLTVASRASARDITVTQGATTDTTTLVYGNIADALKEAQCGDAVTVGPGNYDSEWIYFQSGSDYTYNVGFKNCTADAPLVIQAKNPAVTAWDGKTVGSITRNNCLDDECKTVDAAQLSILQGFKSWRTGTNAFITIKGFVLHEIIMTPDAANNPDVENPTYFSCKNCTIAQNYFNTNYRNCIKMIFIDNLLVEGNYMLNCGGDTEADVALSLGYGDNVIARGNIIKGDGIENGDGFNDSSCTASNWLDPVNGCAGDFHGSDGFTIHNEYLCGIQFYQNWVEGLSPEASSEGHNDGDGSDMKLFKCSDNPVKIFNNVYKDMHGEAQIVFHVGASGIDFFNNIVMDGDGTGILIQAGQECQDSKDYGHMKDIRIFGNIISNNRSGILIRHSSTTTTGEANVCDSNDYRSIENILIAQNTFYQNGAHSESASEGHGMTAVWAHSSDSQIEGVQENTIKVYNNIFYKNDSDENKQIHIKDSYVPYYDFKNNLIDGNFYVVGTGSIDQANYAIQDLTTLIDTDYTGNISGDPLLNSTGDFALSETSPARNKGLDLSALFGTESYYAALMIDMAQNSRNQEGYFDMGSMEYQVPIASAGAATTTTDPDTSGDNAGGAGNTSTDAVQNTFQMSSGGGCSLHF